MPARHGDDAVRRQSGLFQDVNRCDDFILGQVDDADGAIVHFRKIDEAVLDEGVAIIRRYDEVVSASRGRNGRKKLWLVRLGDVEDIESARLGRRDEKAIAFVIEAHFQRQTLAGADKIEYLMKTEIPGLRAPGRGPERAAVHIVNVGHRGILIRRKENFNGRFTRGRGFGREFVCRENFQRRRLDDRDGLTGVVRVARVYRAGDEHPVQIIVQHDAVRILDEFIGRVAAIDGSYGLICLGVAHNNVAGAHAAQEPALLVG